MNRTFKIVARYRSKEDHPKWMQKGKQGTQAKKTVYTSLEDYQKYSPETLKRWRDFYDVSAHELINGKWYMVEIDELV